MLTLIFGIWASEPPRAWRTTEKAGHDKVKMSPLILAFSKLFLLPTINKRTTELYDTHDTHISAYDEVLNVFHLKTTAECTIGLIT